MPQKFLIVGFGSIAKRHIRNLKQIAPGFRIAIWRQKSHSRELDDEFRPLIESVFTSEEEVKDFKPEASLVTNPASHHVTTALFLAGLHSHLFIEKPFSHTLDGIDDVMGMCRSKKLVLTVGYNFRYYVPLLKIKMSLQEGLIGEVIGVRAEVGHYLPAWRPSSDYRETVSSQKELGGGVILELSHEIDYVRWLLGEITEVFAIAAQQSDLQIDVEDTAEIFLKFANGAVGNLHLDMVDHWKNRSCRFVGTKGTLLWDGTDHSVIAYRKGEEKPETIVSPGAVDPNEMFLQELKNFMLACEGKRESVVKAYEARRVVEIVEAIKRSAVERRAVAV